jgi:hypothetical protein
MLKEIIDAYRELGLLPIPLEWDTETKQPKYHDKGWNNVTSETLPPYKPCHTGLMIRTSGEWGCIDFDLKNTDKKDTFDKWMNYLQTVSPDLFGKIFIESTRSGGYHCFIRYKKLPKKTQWAESPTGQEVIALYANGPLIYTYPTPGYSELHQSMEDVELLTDDEFTLLSETSQFFNEYKPEFDPNKKAVSYPEGFESFLSNFDRQISNDLWESILQSIGLVPLSDYRYRTKDTFKAYRRKDSDSKAISAKVYFRTKRVMLFTASMPKFPNWHTKENYPVWALPPSFVLFYRENRDWDAALKIITEMAQSEGIEAPKQTEGFPMHIFRPEIASSIREVSYHRSLPEQFVASACLWGVSALAGNAYENELLPDIPCILYMFFIAPVSVGKSPSIKAAIMEPLKRTLIEESNQFKQLLDAWQIEKEKAAEKKKSFVKPRPVRYLPIIQDGTTESFLSIHMDQPSGVGVFYDEAETLFNAGNYKAINDSVSFLTTIWGGGAYTQTRANRELERVIPDINVNIIMGTQPERLRQIFTEDKILSGFAARWLPVVSDYKLLNEDADPMAKGVKMCREWSDVLTMLYNYGKIHNQEGQIRRIQMTPEAVDIYREYYRKGLRDANIRIRGKAHAVVIGLGAKMSAYLMRITQVIAIMHDPGNPVIDKTVINYGIDTYEYFFSQAEGVLLSAVEEVETGLPKELNDLYNELPAEFDRAKAVEACIKMNLPEGKFDKAIRRKDFGGLFIRVSQGKYAKK